MAKLNPDIAIINAQKVQPTSGERALLNFLINNLDDSYEVYFQPYLNGDNPDVIIMRKGSGVLIIEVKDWDLEHYYIDEKTKWHLKRNGTSIKSPIQQVESYKENLFKLHIEELASKHITHKNKWPTVNCAVYFHNATQKQLISFVTGNFSNNEKYQKKISYFGFLGKDSLNASDFNNLLSKFWLNKPSKIFDDVLYNSFYRYFKPPVHQLEEGINITYTKEQQLLIPSQIRPRRKIKGVAGSGKTLVLAKRAVNAHIRTNGKVLILTYNLSLKNYIHDRINDVRATFLWGNFYITNYHQFFKAEANNYNLDIKGFASWRDVTFFEPVKAEINKYDVVLIDEIQDYEQEWIDIITQYFIHQDTEFVVFGDEKQNIYDREMDENNEPIVRTIPGTWNKSLNTSHRFASNIANIAIKFQKQIFGTKYSLDEISVLSQMDFEKRIIQYHFYKNTSSASEICRKIYQILNDNKIHSSDAGVLCSKVEFLRELDYVIRTSKNERTNTTFESKEEFDELDGDKIKEIVEDIRRAKKYHFWMKTGTMKLSTIHSFKGWEIDTLFLVIEDEAEDDFTNAELIYTAITRARKNLIIFNLKNAKYHSFFKNEISDNYEYL